MRASRSPKCALHPVEALGVGPLEGEDRLLAVAHHEDRAQALGLGALAGRELVGEPFDDGPLAGRGVLRLVHEDVVDAAVEPPEHPLRHGRVGQQPPGAGDQVVEVEEAAGELLALVGLHEGAGERRGGRGCGHGPGGRGAARARPPRRA
jgi:hypothetical protein